MLRQHTSIISTLVLLASLLLATCSSAPAVNTATSAATQATAAGAGATSTPPPTPAVLPTASAAPTHFVAYTLLKGGARPDDLAFGEVPHA